MGQVSTIKIFFVTLCLLFVGLQVNFNMESSIAEKEKTLVTVIDQFGNWKTVAEIPLQESVRNTLHLDDYLFRSFTNGSELVNLYIGYYFSNRKVGASHDPLVCFPGQGWTLEGRDKGVISAGNSDNGQSIHYATMTAERGDNKVFLLYWFQAFDKSTADTLSQKVVLLWRKILTGGEESAFVRISLDMNGRTREECFEILSKFARNFYPVFMQYIKPTALTGEK